MGRREHNVPLGKMPVHHLVLFFCDPQRPPRLRVLIHHAGRRLLQGLAGAANVIICCGNQVALECTLEPTAEVFQE